jgi:hypothetical protein
VPHPPPQFLQEPPSFDDFVLHAVQCDLRLRILVAMDTSAAEGKVSGEGNSIFVTVIVCSVCDKI